MRVSADEAKIIKAYRMGASLNINFHRETVKSALYTARQFGHKAELTELMPGLVSDDFYLVPRTNVNLFADV